MRKAGGIIAVIAELLALGTTFLTMLGDTIELAWTPGYRQPSNPDFIVFNFANGLLFSFLAIVLGAILIGIGGRPARRGLPALVLVLLAVGRRIPGLLLIAVAVQELYYNELGAFVLLFLMFAAIGGFVSILPDFGAARRTAKPTGG